MKKNTWCSSCSTVPSVEVSTFYRHLKYAWSCFWPSWVLSTPGVIRTFPLFCWHHPVSTSPPMLSTAWTCTSHAHWWSILTDCGLLKPLVNPLRKSLCLKDNNNCNCITDCGALVAPCTGIRPHHSNCDFKGVICSFGEEILTFNFIMLTWYIILNKAVFNHC